MRVATKCVCRAHGQIYIEIEIHESSNRNFQIRSDASGALELACRLNEITNPDDSESRRFVAILPITKKPSQKYSIIEYDTDGNEADTATLAVSQNSAKWKSRLNYRRNKQQCLMLRELANRVDYDSPRIEAQSCSLCDGFLLLRGRVCLPYKSDNEPVLTVFNDEPAELEKQPTFVGSSLAPYPFNPDESERLISFSVRLPLEIRRYIFVVQDAKHPELSNFMLLDTEELDKIMKTTAEIQKHAQRDASYPLWFENHRLTPEQARLQTRRTFPTPPLFSIVVPLFNTPVTFFDELIASFKAQTYSHWELILVNASPGNSELDAAIKRAASDKRIKIVALEKNHGITRNTNAGISEATGDYICFVDHDDTVEPDLLYCYASAIAENSEPDVLYCDEDKLFPSGEYKEPFFKPDFDIDLLRNNNYVCHMLCIKKKHLNTLVLGDGSLDGAQDYDLTLKAVEKTTKVFHIPRVLYHWRISDSSTAGSSGQKPYAIEAGKIALESHLNRTGINATVELGEQPFTYQVAYGIPAERPLVSIIIPSKDQIDVLKRCLESIANKTTYDNYEIIIVENNSTDPRTWEYYNELDRHEDHKKLKIEHWPGQGFNFSKIVNYGVKQANGDYLILLNNDTEVITENWIEIMLGICSRKDVGAVGARLYYPDETIQHAGVCITGEIACHLARELPKGEWGYFDLANKQRELSAVTAACIMVKKKDYFAVGGFTETLAVAFNDIDFCLKLREHELFVVYSPQVELFHFESISRGAENSVEKRIRFEKEKAFMRGHWSKYYVSGDPYHNRNFNNLDPYCCYHHL